MKKRLLGSLFSGFMLCLAAQSAVWADTTPITDTDLQWEISGNELMISKNEDGQTGETAIPDCNGNTDQPWKDNISAITSVTIGDGVTGIGTNAFFDHTALTSATIGAGVESIGQRAFSGCEGLTSIDLKNVKTIGDGAFGRCTELATVTGTEHLTSIGGTAFSGCSKLTSVDLPCSTAFDSSKDSSTFGDNTTVYKHHKKLESVEQTPATCTTPEIVAHKKCKYCGQLFATESTLESLGKSAKNRPSVLVVITPVLTITYFEVDESELVGYPLPYELDFVPAKAGTCIEKGTKEHYVCTTCGKTFVISEKANDGIPSSTHLCSYSGVPYACAEIDNVETDYGPHQYGELIEKVPATCTKNGCEAHYECEVCGGKFVIAISEDGKETYKEVSGKDLIIPATGHSYGEWEITKAPTTTSEGEKTRKCSICDSAETDVIPKLAEEKTSGVVSSAATTYGYAVDTGDFVSGEMLAYAYSLCVSGMAFVSLRKKKSKV